MKVVFISKINMELMQVNSRDPKKHDFTLVKGSTFSSVSKKVSYLLEGGSMAHEDFCGHVGKMNPGDLQVWPW